MISEVQKVKATRVFSMAASVLLLFWWPLSHLFYSDWYHALLGFAIGSYQESMVFVIGICGFLPVMNLMAIAADPVRYKANIAIMMVFSFLLACMYVYLILKDIFPPRELLNVAICLLMIVALSIIAPWKTERGHYAKSMNAEEG